MDHPELQKVETELRIIESKTPTLIAKGTSYLKSHGPAIAAVIGSIVCVFVIIKAFGV